MGISNAVLVEITKPVLAFGPLVPSSASPVWISLSKAARVSIILQGLNDSTGGVSAITLNQATNTAGAGSKSLAFTQYYLAAGIINPFVPNDTYVTTTVNSNTFNTPTTASTQWCAIIEVLGTQLDVNNGFDCIQVAIGNQSHTTISALYLVRDIRWPDISPPTSLS